MRCATTSKSAGLGHTETFIRRKRPCAAYAVAAIKASITTTITTTTTTITITTIITMATKDAGHHAPHDLVRIEKDILARNDAYARENRDRLNAAGVFAVNLVSSPGSGKTTLLVKTIEMLKASLPVAVIEGDQETSLDAERIRATGVPTVQINTGRGCHLDAHMVGHALDDLPPKRNSILFIENVGNLVCPAGFDLGEAQKIAILSVTEGDDKPLKYPDAFAAASTDGPVEDRPPAASRFRRRAAASRMRARSIRISPCCKCRRGAAKAWRAGSIG